MLGRVDVNFVEAGPVPERMGWPFLEFAGPRSAFVANLRGKDDKDSPTGFLS